MRISIITVCLNAESTIEKTVQSVFLQSYSNIEYIVVDGKSSDGTVERLYQYKDKIDVLVSEKDQGIYDAMNKGINLATGEALFFLNAGDYFVDKEVVQDIANCFMRNCCSIVYGKINFVNTPHRLQLNILADLWKFNTPFKSRRELLAQRMSQQNFFVRKEVFNQVGNFNINYYVNADFDWLLRCINCNVPIFFVDRFIANLSFGGLSYQRRYHVLLTKIWIVFKNSNLIDFLYFFYHGIFSLLNDVIQFRKSKKSY